MESTNTRNARLELLYRQHAQIVYRYALRRLPSKEDAEDVTMDTFLLALDRLDEMPCEALPWLLGVARRKAANVRRTHQRSQRFLEEYASNAEPSRASTIVECDIRGIVRRLLGQISQLNEKDKASILLVAWHGLKPDDAAAILGCSPQAVRHRICRTRQALSAMLLSHKGY